jgi:spermidine/putrescine transport system permease protein
VSLDRLVAYSLRGYFVLALIFIFVPIGISFIFSFSPNRFPTLPLGEVSTIWYEAILNEAPVSRAFGHSVTVGVIVALVSTFIGFAAAYTDYRYRFFGKSFYLALALLPPTIPVLILGLTMLMYLSRVSLVGELYSVIFAHVVFCIPFAMALIRLRLAQMDPDLESAAWNLGANNWRAMRDVILPFTLPSIIAALFLTMAVSFDEFMIAFFVGGVTETLPVRVLMLMQGQVSPRINAIGSVVFTISMTLVILTQILLLTRRPGERRVAAEGA